MTIEYSGLGATYHGFAGPRPPAPDRTVQRKRMLLAGVGVALALGLGLGFLAQPKIAVYEPKAMAAATAPSQDAMQIVVDRPVPPPPLVRSTGRLEVLPPDMAAAAPRVQPVAAAPSPEAPVLQPAVNQLQPVAPVERAAPEPVAADEDAPIDCRHPAGPEEAGICRDIGFSRPAARERDVYDPRAAEMDEAWDRR